MTDTNDGIGSVENGFAHYVRLVGRGPNVSRPLSSEEAEDAMGIILDGRAVPAQVGAFLALMRYRKETPAELCGFVRAARSCLTVPRDIAVDL